MKLAAVFAVALFGLGTAPFQCAGSSKPDATRRTEDDPAQGLFDLAAQFQTSGNEKARVDTLTFLMKRYPASRYAEQARMELEKK